MYYMLDIISYILCNIYIYILYILYMVYAIWYMYSIPPVAQKYGSSCVVYLILFFCKRACRKSICRLQYYPQPHILQPNQGPNTLPVGHHIAGVCRAGASMGLYDWRSPIPAGWASRPLKALDIPLPGSCNYRTY